MGKFGAERSRGEWQAVPGSDRGYGPRIERRSSPAAEYPEATGEGWLTEAQRKRLRALLLSLGIAVTAVEMGKRTAPEQETEKYPTVGTQTEVVASQHEREQSAVDAFTAEVEQYASAIDEVDLQLTLDLATKPVRGHEHLSRLAFATGAVMFRSEPDERRKRPAVPELLQAELRRLVPGWLAQESRFKGDAVSSSRATGIAQIKPNVWREYRGTDQVSLRMDEQLQVFGELVSDNYHYILHFAGADAVAALRTHFATEDDFLRDLMTPLMVNAYNAGGPAIGRALRQFVATVPTADWQPGKELFVQFAAFAHEHVPGYGVEQRQYAPKVYAFQDLLGDQQT